MSPFLLVRGYAMFVHCFTNLSHETLLELRGASIKILFIYFIYLRNKWRQYYFSFIQICQFKTKSIRKLSNFNFQWTKNTRIISSIFLFTLFKGYKCNKLYEITPKKRFFIGFYWSPRKQTSKISNFTKLTSYAWQFYLCFLSSCEIWNLFSWAPVWNLSVKV